MQTNQLNKTSHTAPFKFHSHGYDYQVDSYGAIHQLNADPYTYDAAYSATYDTDAYRRQSDILQALRFGFITAAHGRPIESLTDTGYGNGAFMKFARQCIPDVYGIDVTGVQVPEYCHHIYEHRKVDVICYWDVLEHIPDLSFLKTLPCETLAISLPYCHINEHGTEFIKSYKHFKVNEHLHHFDAPALQRTLAHHGWRKVAWGGHEDIVRKSAHPFQNILTMAFKR